MCGGPGGFIAVAAFFTAEVNGKVKKDEEIGVFEEVEKVADDWGFTDRQVAQAMLNRKMRFNRAKSKKMKQKRLEDPDYKYQLLMKRVKANRSSTTGIMSGGSERKAPRRSRSSGGGSRSKPMGKPVKSQVGKDRLNMRRKNRRKMPAWKPTFGEEDQGGRAVPAPPPNTKMRLNNWTNSNNDSGDNNNTKNSRSRSMFPPLK